EFRHPRRSRPRSRHDVSDRAARARRRADRTGVPGASDDAAPRGGVPQTGAAARRGDAAVRRGRRRRRQSAGGAGQPAATLIDTSVLIAAQRGQIDLDAIIDAEGDDDVAIASICAAELLHGPHRLPTAAARTRAERAVEALLEQFRILMFDMDIARVHARLAADLASRGAM